MTKVSLSILKFIILVVILIASFKLNSSMPFLLVIGYVSLSLLWNWEKRINLIAGIILLGAYYIFKITRPDLIIENLDLYGWIFIGSWLAVFIVKRITLLLSLLWQSKPDFESIKKYFTKKLTRRYELNFKFIKSFLIEFIRFINTFIKLAFIGLYKSLRLIILIILETIKTIFKIILVFYQEYIKPKSLWTKLRVIIILYLVWFLLSETEWQVVNIVIFVSFVSALLFRWFWADRISFVLALILLASCPFFLIQEKEIQAEVAAIYAYYFLVIGVVLQIAEFSKLPKFSFSKINPPTFWWRIKNLVKKIISCFRQSRRKRRGIQKVEG